MSSPTGFAIALILAAAVLHATWNALMKGSGDRAFSMGLLNFAHGIVGLVMVFLFAPPVAESWPFLIASTVIHFFYYGFLILAYRHGDLSQVYPIARGVAPVLVALGAQAIAGETLPPVAWGGILLVSFGICVLFLERGTRADPRAVAAALMTGATIAAYSVADGLGARVSASPLGYIGWLFLLECIAGVGFMVYRRSVIRQVSLRTWVTGLAGGFISAAAYGLAIIAKTLTTLGTVSAIRESSVIIAALIGVVWFGERPWQLRVAASVVVAAGVVLLATA